MQVLVACEFSGVVRDAFRKRGHDAWSADLKNVDATYHFQGDVMEVLQTVKGWDMMIAFPPCTYLANSGVRWLHERPERWAEMRWAAWFFNALLSAPIERVCVENPIQHGHARQLIRPPDQRIQPWMFGHGEKKATCLWLKGLPPLMPTHVVDGREQRVWKMGPSEDRSDQRSITYQGIANAMAEQWGG